MPAMMRAMLVPIRECVVSGARVALVCLMMFSATPVLAGNPSESFYGEIPKFDSGRLERVRTLLNRIEIECPDAEQKCPVSRELLREISGDLNSDELPFLIVYLDENLSVRVNRIIWKGDVTPFVYGVQNVWTFLFLEKPVNL